MSTSVERSPSAARRRGVGVLLVVMLLAVTGILIAAGLAPAQERGLVAVALRDGESAFFAAESGGAVALAAKLGGRSPTMPTRVRSLFNVSFDIRKKNSSTDEVTITSSVGVAIRRLVVEIEDIGPPGYRIVSWSERAPPE